MTIRKTFEQAMSTLIYAAALVIVGGGTVLMCLPSFAPIT
jgi:hypothetical protein